MTIRNNTFDDAQVVDNLDDIQLIPVAPLEDGCKLWASNPRESFRLFKSGLPGATPNGTTIIAPAAGNPIAGAADAIWVNEELLGMYCGSFYNELLSDQTIGSGGVFVTLVSVTATLEVPARLAISASASGRMVQPETTDPMDVQFRIQVNGATVAGAHESNDSDEGSSAFSVAMVDRFPLGVNDAPAGTYTVTLQWRVDGPGLSSAQIAAAGSPDTESAALHVECVQQG